MSRFAACVLCALTALAVQATPAPPPEHWVTGWDRPVDPDRDCRFDRKGDRLTITIPGKEHTLRTGLMNAPRLLRDMEGDFIAQVRVSGTVLPAAMSGDGVTWQGAGLILQAGDEVVVCLRQVWLQPGRAASDEAVWELSTRQARIERHQGEVSPPRPGLIHLRLGRQGGRILAALSEDGVRWTRWEPEPIMLPQKLKVGVVAVTTSGTDFQPEFDQFKLTRPDK